MNTTNAAPSAHQRVADHLASAFGLPADGLVILPLTPRDLPAGSAEFYVEAKGGGERRNCVVLGDKAYCSGADGEFARLLREQALPARKDLNAAQLMRLYSLLALPRQLKYIDANVLARNPQAYRAYPEVQAPTLTGSGDAGLVLTFYATPVNAVQPSKWTVAISRSGEVEVSSPPRPAR